MDYPETVGSMVRESRCITPGRSSMGRIGGIAGRRESAEVKAGRGLRADWGRLRWAEGMLGARRKGMVEKAALATGWRAEATMTLAWVADRLRMGTKAHLEHQLSREDRESKA